MLVLVEIIEVIRNVLQEQARNVAKVSNECKMEVMEDKYVSSFNPGLMDVVYQWVNGATFSEIVKTTDVFEGICFFFPF